jgi:hypothetical protein
MMSFGGRQLGSKCIGGTAVVLTAVMALKRLTAVSGITRRSKERNVRAGILMVTYLIEMMQEIHHSLVDMLTIVVVVLMKYPVQCW